MRDMFNTSKKTKKAKTPLLGEFPAHPAAAVAIRELLKLREQRRILTAKTKLLHKIIQKHGGGVAHGYRAYVQVVPGGMVSYRRSASIKVVLTPYKPAENGPKTAEAG